MLTSWLNSTRLKIYPRLIYITTSVILLLNALLGKGWIGAAGQVIGGDFIMLYSSGVLFRHNPSQLYNFEQLAVIQQELIAPAQMWGVMPFFNYPPYVVSVTSLLSRIPLITAFVLMTLTTILAIALTSILFSRCILPDEIAKSSLPAHQVFFLIASSLAFIEGLQMGQNHGLTLLFMTAAVVFSLRQHWFKAGVMAGLLLYKPHFTLGFLIIWLMCKRWNALIGFGSVAVAWAGTFLLQNGVEPFSIYLENSTLLLQMVYLEGFGGYLEVTPYGILIDLLPQSAWWGIVIFIQIIFACVSIVLAFLALKQSDKPMQDQVPVYVLAILFPLIVSPHALLHDMLVISLALALWSRFWPGKSLLQLSIWIYMATFILPILTYYLDIALLSLITMGLTSLLLFQIFSKLLIKQTQNVI